MSAADESQARLYRESHEALESGYEAHYARVAGHIRLDTLSVAQCREVSSVMDMYQAAQAAFDGLEDQSDIDPQDLVFRGFDAKTEPRLWAYSKYLCQLSDNQYARFAADSDLDSGQPMLPTYRRMLAVWNNVIRRRRLTRSNLQQLLAASRD
jgi:uncharacterized protein YfbU (UPF0304 family)